MKAESAIFALAILVVALFMTTVGVLVLKNRPDLSPKTNWTWPDSWKDDSLNEENDSIPTGWESFSVFRLG